MYIVSNLKDGGDIQPLYVSLTDPSDNFVAKYKPAKPEYDVSGEVDEVDMEIYCKEVKQFVQQKTNMRRNLERTYGLVWGQCSSGLQTYIKGLSYFETGSSIFDALWLLREIKKAISGIDDKANAYISMHDAISQLYRMKQGSQEANDNYLARFKTNVAAVELTGGKHIFASPIISGLPVHEMTPEELDKEVDKSKAIIFLKCADESRFGALSKRLREATYLDRDEYPTTLSTMYELMTKSCLNIQTSSNNNNSRNRRNGVSLLQRNKSNEDQNIPGTDGRSFDVVCYNCNRRGHYASSCPNPNTTVGISNLQYGYMMTQIPNIEGLIPPDWVLLDTCSTNNVVHDSSLLTDTKKCSKNKEMKVHTNGGSLRYDTLGSFKYLPIICYHNEKSIANVLSLKNVSDIPRCNIYMDTNIGPEIYIKYRNLILKFNQSVSGLYYCHVHDLEIFHTDKDSTHAAISLLSTMPNKYTKIVTTRTKAARNLQKAMMWSSSNMMKKLIKNGLITHTNITEDDFDIANEIFGVAPKQVKGKTTSPSQKRDVSLQILLSDIKIDINKRIKLYIDIMYICGSFFSPYKIKRC